MCLVCSFSEIRTEMSRAHTLKACGLYTALGFASLAEKFPIVTRPFAPQIGHFIFLDSSHCRSNIKSMGGLSFVTDYSSVGRIVLPVCR